MKIEPEEEKKEKIENSGKEKQEKIGKKGKIGVLFKKQEKQEKIGIVRPLNLIRNLMQFDPKIQNLNADYHIFCQVPEK